MEYGIRPAFVLPSDFAHETYADGNGNFYPEQEYIIVLSDVLGNVLNVGAKVAVGSYVGTGAYGATNPNSLTFDFVPKYVLIRDNASGANASKWVAIFPVCRFNEENLDGYKGWSYVGDDSSAPSTYANTRFSKLVGKTLSWYITSKNSYGPREQLNNNSTTYSYLAFG